ncbi:hypothetical protein [Haloarchaeobius sp. TZWWS8]|uniref:hypothetical protein n=1 Tax=Haloarchaeobius sp. TZWWS8 TaxID=3446121 RepID=UPI003EB9880B
MSDLLTHVLAAYVLATVASWRFSAIAARHVPLAMVGAVVPDAAKAYMLTGDPRFAVAGVELSWYALQTVGAAACFVLAGSLLFPREDRRVVLGVLSGAVGLHVCLDYLVIRAGGLAPPYLYPLTWVQLPSADVYLSSSLWPSLVAVPLACVVWLLDRRRSGDVDSQRQG